MKNIIVVLFIFATAVYAQSIEENIIPSKLQLAASFGIGAVNPSRLNDRIAASNYIFNSTAKTIKSVPEIGGTIIFRPQDDIKILVLRAGYIWFSREFPFSVPQTTTSPTQKGTINGKIIETCTIYPFSFGVGVSSLKSDYRFQIELIYAISNYVEEGSYSATAAKQSYSRTLFSPAYGFRAAGTAIVPVSERLGLSIEFGYRYLTFDEYEDEKGGAIRFVEIPVNGITGNFGLQFGL